MSDLQKPQLKKMVTTRMEDDNEKTFMKFLKIIEAPGGRLKGYLKTIANARFKERSDKERTHLDSRAEDCIKRIVEATEKAKVLEEYLEENIPQIFYPRHFSYLEKFLTSFMEEKIPVKQRPFDVSIEGYCVTYSYGDYKICFFIDRR